MRDDWLDDPQEAAGPRPRPRVLLLAAASLPWLLVLGLLILPGRVGEDGHADHEAAHRPDEEPAAAAAGAHDDPEEDDPEAPDPDATPDGAPDPGPTADRGDAEDPVERDALDTTSPPGAGPDDTGGLDVTEIRGRWRPGPGIEEAAALATLVARAWLTGIDPVLDIDGLGPLDEGYAEHLIVEAVDHPAPDAAVVTIVAIVLRGDPLEASVRRLAVPVLTLPDGPRPAGPPWELPGPDLRPAGLERTSIDDPEDLLAAAEALRHAGLDGATLEALHVTEGWPFIAEVRTDEGAPTTEIWLRRHLDGFVVAGSTLAGDTSTEPSSEGLGDPGDGTDEEGSGTDGADRRGPDDHAGAVTEPQEGTSR